MNCNELQCTAIAMHSFGITARDVEDSIPPRQWTSSNCCLLMLYNNIPTEILNVGSRLFLLTKLFLVLETVKIPMSVLESSVRHLFELLYSSWFSNRWIGWHKLTRHRLPPDADKLVLKGLLKCSNASFRKTFDLLSTFQEQELLQLNSGLAHLSVMEKIAAYLKQGKDK